MLSPPTKEGAVVLRPPSRESSPLAATTMPNQQLVVHKKGGGPKDSKPANSVADNKTSLILEHGDKIKRAAFSEKGVKKQDVHDMPLVQIVDEYRAEYGQKDSKRPFWLRDQATLIQGATNM